MNDDRLGLDLREWMKDTEYAPPDARQSARQVATRLPRTRQVGRWWPFPISYRRTHTPPTTDTIEYEPIPIPATNGHTPTVIGRTQSMFSPAKAITAGALIFAIGGVFLIAQPFGQQVGVPGAATIDLGPAAYVHGTMVELECCGDEVETFDDAGNRLTLRGSASSGTMRMDDPRLSGDWEGTVNVDEFPQLDTGERVEVQWGGLTITNDDGTWAGTWTSTYDSAAVTETELIQYELTGDGAYAGLSAVLSITGGEWPAPSTIAGAVFPGPLPPDSPYGE